MEANATNMVKATRGSVRRLFRLGDLSIRVRLIACFILIVLLMIGADAVAVWQFRQMTAPAQRVSKAEQTSYAVIRVHLDVDTFRDSMAALGSSHDTRQFAGDAASIRRIFLEHVDHAEQMLRASPDIEQDATISSALESLRVTLLSQVDAAVQLANAGEWNAVRLRLENQIPAIVEFSSLLVERVDQQALLQRSKATEDAQKARERLFIIVPIAALLTLLAAAALGWYVTRTITTALSELTASAEALAQGDFQHRVNVRGNNELAVLGSAFNYAALQLQKLYGDLRRSERELRDVINTVPAHVWSASPEGTVDFINEPLLDFVGLSPDDMLGWTWESVLHPEDRNRHEQKWSASVSSGDPFEIEVRFRRANGEYRWFLVRAVPMRAPYGKIAKWYGTTTDIEDRKRAELLRAELAHLNRINMMGELLASISHELKQPITASVVNASTALRWLNRDPPNVNAASEVTNKIVKSGKLAGEIIDRLRSLYKNALPKREPLALNEIIRDVIVMLRAEATRHGVSIRADLGCNLPTVSADRVQIQQVLMNLMLNGIESMNDTGGVLTVELQSGKDGQIQISVNDTGVGLPQGEAGRIFDAFFTTKPQGSGMGLAICKSIVESHGGHIWANSNGGRGAAFNFTLPPIAARSAASNAEE